MVSDSFNVVERIYFFKKHGPCDFAHTHYSLMSYNRNYMPWMGKFVAPASFILAVYVCT
jgi:hypothetical protein